MLPLYLSLLNEKLSEFDRSMKRALLLESFLLFQRLSVVKKKPFDTRLNNESSQFSPPYLIPFLLRPPPSDLCPLISVVCPPTTDLMH